jgi:CelD/BcsL family acetyltransferase involved in cellulose biosynthesis
VRVYRLDPLRDPRWIELVERHPHTSIFHTRGWLEALQQTYGYTPIVFTTSSPGQELRNTMVFCEIRSWLTGQRLVSLPFSDHCDPLIEDTEEFLSLCEQLVGDRKMNGWRYLEVRPWSDAPGLRSSFSPAQRFYFHALDLRPASDALFRAFHKDSTQRKIRRAEREGLAYEDGRAEELLRAFYGLVLQTRQRHQLPPQPFAWFRNIATFLPDAMTIRIARRGDRPVAGVLTLRHRDTMVYKYAASDAAYHNLGGMQLVMWKLIQDARAKGCLSLDLGRSNEDDLGLLTFKDRWGAARSTGVYWRNPAPAASSPLRSWVLHRAEQAFAHVPGGFRAAAGRILYKHVG